MHISMGSSSASKQHIRSFVARDHRLARASSNCSCRRWLGPQVNSMPRVCGTEHGVLRTDIRVASANVVLTQHPTIPCLVPGRSHGGWANSGAESGNYRQALISTLSTFWQNRAASHIPRIDSEVEITIISNQSVVKDHLENALPVNLQSQQLPKPHAHALATREA
jgi:hypothetical protein